MICGRVFLGWFLVLVAVVFESGLEVSKLSVVGSGCNEFFGVFAFGNGRFYFIL